MSLGEAHQEKPQPVNGEVHGVCDVHRLLDGDTSPRKVRYCGLCKSWICEEDRSNWPRRIRAAVAKGMEG